jgi:hypothetical protein
MTSYRNDKPAIAAGALADEDLDLVIGGCFGVPVTIPGGGIVYVSPTTGLPHLPTGTLPTFPTFPRGPFPV